jgi:hypothetical protein
MPFADAKPLHPLTQQRSRAIAALRVRLLETGRDVDSARQRLPWRQTKVFHLHVKRAVRGEVGALPAMRSIVRRAPGEGDSLRVELAERAPHPNPLPANSGEREEKLAAAATPTQSNLIMPYAFADAGTRPNNCACSRRAASTSRLVASSITAAMRVRNSVRDRPGGSGSRNSTTSVPG